MAKGAYLGIGDTARKVKNIYVGVIEQIKPTGLSGVLGVDYSTVGYNQYGSNSTYSDSNTTNTVINTDESNPTTHWNMTSGSYLDICFRFGENEKKKIKKVVLNIGTGYGTPTCTLYYSNDNSSLIELENLSLTVDATNHSYNVNSGGVEANLWVFRFQPEKWVDVKVCSIYIEGVDGVARNVIKCYIGDANGKAQLCFEDVNTESTQEWSTAGTYSVTVPDWATKAVITACGGGGGGAFGSSSSGYFPGGGGGGGGAAVYETEYVVSSLKGQSISITVGAGGTAGSSSGRSGGAGGNTIIGSILTLNGGSGGIIHSGSSPSPGGSAGGAGGGAGGKSGGSQSDSSSGTSGGSGVLGRGGSGGSNIDYGEGTEAGGGGGGGSLGDGGKGATGASTNNTAGTKGGGGGGGSSYHAGAAGGTGYVKITWYKR